MKKVEHVGAVVQKRPLVRSKELKGFSVSRCFKFRSKIGMETAIQAPRSAYREKRVDHGRAVARCQGMPGVNVMRPYMESLI